jgi:hypothetical protein
MRTIEHYVLINGKVICELVSKDDVVDVSRVSVDTGCMDGDASTVELQIRARPEASPAPETSAEQ